MGTQQQAVQNVTGKRVRSTYLSIVSLLANPVLTQQQIAEMVGVSRQTVARAAKQLKLELGSDQKGLEAYKRAIAAKVPIEARVDRLSELINQNKDMKTALQALTRADHLLGIVTEAERPPRYQEPPAQQPAFVLPAGSQVSMLISTPPTTTDSGLSQCETKQGLIEATATEAK